MSRPGRPQLKEGQTTTVLQVRLPESLHDEVCLVALKQGTSVSAVLRAAVLDWLKHQHFVLYP